MSNIEQVYPKLGANEKAIVDKIKIRLLRNVFIQLIGVKLRLQWKGWLQYLIPIPVTMFVFLIGGIIFVINEFTSKIIFTIGGLLLLKIAYDIITVKYRVHPKESLPESSY